MKLYHFCSEQHLEEIKKDGLTLGRLPIIVNNQIGLVKDFQWLTSNADFEQSWEKHSTLPYRRNAFRITVKIPKGDKNLLKWDVICKAPQLLDTAKVLNSHGDFWNWYVYKGKVKKNYFREIVKNEK